MFRRLFSFLCMLLAFQAASAEEKTTHVFGENVFSIKLPKSWVRDTTQKYFSVSSPDKRVAFTASAYSKDGGSLEEFANYRFSSIHEWYKAVGPVKTFKAENVNAIYREFEGTWPGESKPTYYVVACLSLGNAYASITFTTDRQDFTAKQARYVQILHSVRPGS